MVGSRIRFFFTCELLQVNSFAALTRSVVIIHSWIKTVRAHQPWSNLYIWLLFHAWRFHMCEIFVYELLQFHIMNSHIKISYFWNFYIWTVLIPRDSFTPKIFFYKMDFTYEIFTYIKCEFSMSVKWIYVASLQLPQMLLSPKTVQLVKINMFF